MTNRYCAIALLACVAALAACDQNGIQSITGPETGAAVKFFNFSVSSPGLNFFAGTQKLTAISSTSCQPPNDTTSVCRSTGVESTVGTAYGAAASGALYNQVPAGSVTLTGNIAATTDKNLAVTTITTTVETGKFYSYFVSGIYDATGKKADAFVVEDPIPAITDATTAYVRFVNAASSSQPMILYAKDQTGGAELPIGTSVAYKSAGTFTAIPGAVYDLSVRLPGSTTGLITRTSVSFSAGHVYTITARGDMVSTLAAAKPALDNTANR
jgi:hypothetical protein